MNRIFLDVPLGSAWRLALDAQQEQPVLELHAEGGSVAYMLPSWEDLAGLRDACATVLKWRVPGE